MKTPKVSVSPPDGPATYVVDAAGYGTHKTIEAAFVDAGKTPERTTFIQIRPIIRLPESAQDWSD